MSQKSQGERLESLFQTTLRGKAKDIINADVDEVDRYNVYMLTLLLVGLIPSGF